MNTNTVVRVGLPLRPTTAAPTVLLGPLSQMNTIQITPKEMHHHQVTSSTPDTNGKTIATTFSVNVKAATSTAAPLVAPSAKQPRASRGKSACITTNQARNNKNR